MKKNDNTNVEKNNPQKKKTTDLITIIILLIIIIVAAIFIYFNFIPTDDVAFMEIYRSDGPIAESYTDYNYTFYKNGDDIKMKVTGFSESTNKSTNTEIFENVDKDLVENFEKDLVEYINSNAENNYIFSINDRYTIKYNGASITVPNPRTAELLDFEPEQYEFYNAVAIFLSSVQEQ